MSQRRIILLSTLLVAALLGVAMALVWFRSAPRVSGLLRHEVYVWQRAWTQPVRDAVAQHATNFAEVVALKAEISWKDKRPQLTRANVDYATLAATKVPVGVALRIGPYPGPFTPPVQGAPASGTASRDNSSPRAVSETGAPPRVASPSGAKVSALRESERPLTRRDATLSPSGGEGWGEGAFGFVDRGAGSLGEGITAYLCDVAARLVNEARTNGVTLAELQLDFDCAESKLDGYRIWVEAIQRRVAPLPVTITALPSWLDSRAFKRLAAGATNYVLQVHSVERPKSFDAPFNLCDPRSASRAVERAGRIGVPFRVALPTYGYTLAFDASGKFFGLSAEGPRPNWPTNALLREVHSDPIELAGLVQQWTASRPAALRGVIWYRLPTIVDNFNWRWPTLGAIVAARVPAEKFRVSARRVESGLVEISLANEGELDISSRLAVEVRWSNARLVAGDALRDFELADRSASAARFQTRSQPSRIRAGETRVLGWLRFDRDCEVRCEFKKL